ncbi:predicted protein [Sclerotinia sclerotiorum 1980 UF-70]|uniref:Uncharacterized protein n=1 Tax=Sclerotinia sclerotiorum (strain ATCC 18683 / 1980 / Ss-1) TaxID=665079 RepID=A7EJ40_SCLS1|nr:predicted protein [Sclerotinia sclerotiorum 1980 UF-70]EDO02856.1 predicted protein [Sclerotinia sclerotiorum 1980 UF-70]
MSDKHSIHSEDEPSWSPKDVEESLLPEEINGTQNSEVLYQRLQKNHPKDWYGHLDHCADMLRQKLMCEADTGIVTYNWMKGHTNPHPNFNVQHECRDFNAILEYARDNQVDKESSERIDVSRLKPDDGLMMEFEGEPPFDPDAVPSIRQQ